MEASADFGTTQLFLTDSRLALAVLNQLRHQALHHMFGMSRAQANVLTAVVVLSAADGAYEVARRVTGIRPTVRGGDAALGALAVREAALGVAGPNVRQIPGLGALVVFAFAGAVAAPQLRRAGRALHTAEQSLRRAEQRVRLERIRRYAAARDRARAGAETGPRT
jgi:hypothetical protein